MMFECPVCHNRHIVPDNYDNNEYICTRGKEFQEMTPDDLLSRNGFNMNRSSTRVNETRSATIIIDDEEPQFRPTGERINVLKKNW